MSHQNTFQAYTWVKKCIERHCRKKHCRKKHCITRNAKWNCPLDCTVMHPRQLLTMSKKPSLVVVFVFFYAPFPWFSSRFRRAQWLLISCIAMYFNVFQCIGLRCTESTRCNSLQSSTVGSPNKRVLQIVHRTRGCLLATTAAEAPAFSDEIGIKS